MKLPIPKRILNRAFKGKKGLHDYDIEADKGEYKLKLEYWVDRNLFLQGLAAVQGKVGKRVGVLDRFEVPDKALGLCSGLVKDFLPRMEDRAHKDGKTMFKFLSWQVEKAEMFRKKDRFHLTVFVEGLCSGD